MAKFCSEECEEAGSICDFCTHYRDEYENIIGQFSGDGICDIDGREVDCLDGYDCDNFECIRIKKEGVIDNEI